MMKKNAIMFLSPDGGEGGGADDQNTNNEPDNQNGEGKPDNLDEQGQKIPYSRFKEVNDERKELQRKLKEKEEAEEAQRLKKAEEEGDLKKVNEELTRKVETLKPKAEQFDELEQGIREQALKKIADTLGDDKAKGYADFGTKELQTVVNTLPTNTAPATPGDNHPGARGVDETVQAALKKYGSKANIARLNQELYRKLWPNPRRRNG